MIIFLDIVLGLVCLILWSSILYKPFFKRFYDILLSGLAIILLSPTLLVLTILGRIKMKGNPFFVQARPGKKGKDGKEKIFNLIKFRSMTEEKDKDGNYLPDDKRLTKYGKTLRSTSLDELPELFNIFKGDMAIVGPRPLLVQYLPYYTETERHRHDIRPGLTGLAQVNGRNSIKWDSRLAYDVEYVNHITLLEDVKIIIQTIGKVLNHSDIAVDTGVVETFLDQERSGKIQPQ